MVRVITASPNGNYTHLVDIDNTDQVDGSKRKIHVRQWVDVKVSGSSGSFSGTETRLWTCWIDGQDTQRRISFNTSDGQDFTVQEFDLWIDAGTSGRTVPVHAYFEGWSSSFPSFHDTGGSFFVDGVPPAGTAPGPVRNLRVGELNNRNIGIYYDGPLTGSPVTLYRAVWYEINYTTNPVVWTDDGGSGYTSPQYGNVPGSFKPKPNTTYHVYVDAINQYGRSGGVGIAVTTTNQVPAKPARPTFVSSTTDTIVLTAQDPEMYGSDVLARELEISTSSAFTNIVAVRIGVGNRTTTGLSKGRMYYTRYRVKSEAGASQYSDTLAVTTKATPPTAPTGYSVYDVAATSAKVSVGLLADNGGQVPTMARLKVSTTASDIGLIKTIEQSAWAPIWISGLTEDTQYYVAESAGSQLEGGGWGPYGAWVPLHTINTVPNAPVVQVDSSTLTTASVSWSVPTDLNEAEILSYNLLVASNNAMTAEVREFVYEDETLSQVLDNLIQGQRYYAVVWTMTNMGRGSSSVIIDFLPGNEAAADPFYINVDGVLKNVTAMGYMPTEASAYPGVMKPNQYVPGQHDATWKELQPWINDDSTWKTG